MFISVLNSEHFANRVNDELRRVFRPEFLNRVDEIVVFRPLSNNDLCKIAEMMLSELVDRIEGTGVFIDFDSAVIPFLAARAKADQFGARQMRRELTRLVESPYAEAVIQGRIKSGDLVYARVDGERIIFDKRGN